MFIQHHLIKHILVRLRLHTLLSLILFAGSLSAQQITLIAPSDEAVTGDTLIALTWNGVPTGTGTYQIQCATDSLFTNLVHDHPGVTSTTITLPFGLGQQYRWRVRYHDGTLLHPWSVVRKFTSFSPALLPGIAVWLEADQGVTASNNLVQTWQSKHGSYMMAQTDSMRRPLLTDSALFRQPAIAFDGTNDFLEGSFLNNPELTILMMHNPNLSSGSLFTQARFAYTGFNWHISNTGRPTVACKQTPSGSGFFFSGNQYPFTIPSKRVTIDGLTLKNTGPVIYTGLADSASTQTISFLDNPAITFSRMGAMGNNSSFYKGHIYALVATYSALTKTEIEQVHHYLLWKYQPPVNLGADMDIGYQLCATVLEPAHRYSSYQWSTGDTTHAITVAQAGTYWLQVTDFFGRVSSDTIIVTGQKPHLNLKDTIICFGDTITMHAGLTGPYSYMWNGNPLLLQSFLQVGSNGKVHLTVTDTLGCFLQDSATIILDQYPVLVSLGPDRTSCVGNMLALQAGASQSISYQWSTGINDTMPQVPVTGAGIYSVTVTNTRGCVGSSQVNITLMGASPTAQFQLSSSQICFGDSILITDLSAGDPSDPINTWVWQLGDNTTLNTPGPLQHLYSNPGAYNIHLTVTTDSGCVSTVSNTLLVMNLPAVDLIPKKSCSGDSTTFGFNPQVAPMPVNYQWAFYDQSTVPTMDTATNPAFMWANHGTYPVALSVTNTQGCTNTDTFQITVHQSPITQIVAGRDTVCPGESVTFTENGTASTLFPNQYWYWDFADGTPPKATVVNSESHQFNAPGSYSVKVKAGSLVTGCQDSTTMSLQVNHLPLPQPADINICTGEIRYLSEASSVTGDSIVSWLWWIEDVGYATGRQPAVSYPAPGIYQAMLTVTTATGCVDSAISAITVTPTPVALFSMEPFYGNPPLSIPFTNNSMMADHYLWEFGDGNTSLQEEPTYIFRDAATFEVILHAYTNAGCTSTFTTYVYTHAANADLEITLIEAEIQGNRLRPVIELRNNSPFEIVAADIMVWLSGGQAMTETWRNTTASGRLLPGATIRYPFPASFINHPNDSEMEEILCARALIPSFPIDNNPLNNQLCSPLTRYFTVMKPWPNPAKGEVNFELVVEYPDMLEIELFTLQGRSLGIRFSELLTEGLNRITIPADGSIRGGVYLFALRYRDQIIHHKVIIQPQP